MCMENPVSYPSYEVSTFGGASDAYAAQSSIR